MLGAHHSLLKALRKAVRRGGPLDSKWGVAEGPHLLQEALRLDGALQSVIATEAGAARWAGGLPSGVPLHLVAENTMADISSVETSQGVLSLVRLRNVSLAGILEGAGPVVALDELQDPGNAGTILRAAEAFGASGAVFLKGSVSPWNPKALRASAGSLLRVPVALSEWDALLAGAREAGWALYGASPRGELVLGQEPLPRKSILLVGNEGRGLPAEHESAVQTVRISTERVESLNAALAAGIWLYEAFRRRV